ncbi:CHAT domain-containing protein [Plantactinospora sp. KLBMP9567]|uniref:CHAT domain-containing protein n=1 Tax=Plantactinospora sp. KLBMP9567 TaxID=3085900 RepID=UPI0029827D62|nr:CHAT domain-containing protein [Plantactinospora sp. KLBMP9567]MDW5325058.1 CHAT domain-containing protein [Plantactinospora sp. KLBMP9567]
MSAAAALAARALDLVGADPRRALETADAAVRADGSDRAAVSRAHRAAALALRELGDPAAAERRLRVAVRSAGPVAEAAAEARMSLAFVLVDRGRLRAALVEADRAAAALDGLPAVRLAAQRALILQRTGRLAEALSGYAAALPALRSAGDTLWEARALNNRGLLHKHRGTLEAADADLVRAAALYTELGLHRFAADAEWNRATVAAHRGDVPAALAGFDRAEAAHARAGTPRPQLWLNRSQVLMSVGLTAEAYATAVRAVAALRASGHATDLAEARLLLAEAAVADGRPAEAVTQARTAGRAFARQGRDGWALLARVAALRATSARPRVGLRDALACAEALAAAGWRGAEQDARVVAARFALAAGDPAAAAAQLRRVRPRRATAPLDLRVRWWHAEADRRRAVGDRAGALSALRAGLRQLDDAQAVLGATDMRAHVAGLGHTLAADGLDLVVASGPARAVLVWAERSRARALRLRPVRPPDDPELAAALAELRRLAAAAGPAGPTAAARAAAESRVVRISRMTGGPLHRPADLPPAPAALAAELGERALVAYIRHRDELLAVSLADGRCTLHRLGPASAVTAPLETSHFTLRRLALGLGPPAATDRMRHLAEAAGLALDRLLLAPLRRAVGDRPLVVVPTGLLHAVPWGLLPSVSGRPVTLAPSAAAWLRAECRPARRGHRLFAAGPGLPGARQEAAGLAGRRALLDGAATVESVLSGMDGAALAHVAAHGVLRVDNPLLSALTLADGPLTVYDLERLATAPDTVVLPACQSGVAAVRAGDELLGLASALLALGTRTVVATVLPVADGATEPLMRDFHRRLRSGQRPAAALAAARAGAGPDHAAFAAAASFVCLGG